MPSDTTDTYKEIGKLLFYILILSTNYKNAENFKQDCNPRWIKHISIDLFNCVYNLDDLGIQIKQRIVQLLTHESYDRVEFTFSPSEIQYSKKSTINKKIKFYISKDDRNYQVSKIEDEINMDFDYSKTLPIALSQI